MQTTKVRENCEFELGGLSGVTSFSFVFSATFDIFYTHSSVLNLFLKNIYTTQYILQLKKKRTLHHDSPDIISILLGGFYGIFMYDSRTSLKHTLVLLLNTMVGYLLTQNSESFESIVNAVAHLFGYEHFLNKNLHLVN